MNNENTNKLLHNSENYKKKMNEPNMDVILQYINLIDQYLLQCKENIYIQNDAYYKYVLIKGINTMSHVFNIIYLYTKNLELTYYHCQKSMCYYIEFIGQIGDDNHSFLQLNSKDASLFVYKKTIFDINNEYRKEFNLNSSDNEKISIINLNIQIYNTLLTILINNFNFADEENDLVTSVNNNIHKLATRLFHISLLNNKKKYIENLKIIDFFIKNYSKKYDEKFFLYIDIFIKKIKKKDITKTKIQYKINNSNFNKYNKELTPLRFINWIFNPEDD